MAASATLFPAALVRGGSEVIAGELNAVGWANDVLMVSTVAPWLTPDKQAEIRKPISASAEVVRQKPDAFRGSPRFAAERNVYERVPAKAGDFISTLMAAPADDVIN